MRRSGFVTSLTAMTAAAGGIARAQSAAPLALRVAATANDGYESAYFAQDLGYFTRAGLNVDLTTMSNGAAITAAIVAGAMDVAVSTPIPIANAYLAGLPVVIVAAGAFYLPGGLMLVTAKGSPIKTAKDLEGKTVALNALKTGTEAIVDNWLATNGADPAKIHLIETPFADMGPALVRGAIHVAGMTDPSLSAGLQNGTIQILGDPIGALHDYLLSVWFANADFARKNPEAIRRFNRAIYAAQAYTNTHPAETAPIFAKYAKMDVNLVAAMKRGKFADRMNVAQIQPFLDLAVKYGVLNRPVSAASFIFAP
jgi:NitT/TauT family transport system substrate-binding protein